jgi:hypothetical protein
LVSFFLCVITDSARVILSQPSVEPIENFPSLPAHNQHTHRYTEVGMR